MRAALLAGVALALPFALTGQAVGRSAARGPWIVFDRNGDLYAVALDRPRPVRLTSSRARERAPAVSPDGRTIAFVRESQALGGSIWKMRVDGARRTRLTRGAADYGPVWSPDGRTLYFVRFVAGQDGDPCGAVFRVGSSGGAARRVLVPPAPHSFVQPAISPDGRRIAHDDWYGCSGGTSSPRLRVVDTAGRLTSDLAKLPNNGFYPNPAHFSAAWAPDGKRIAFGRDGMITVANRDGSGATSITQRLRMAVAWTHPAWSRDGKWIAFVSADGGLYVVRSGGGGIRRLATAGGSGSTPSWLPRLSR